MKLRSGWLLAGIVWLIAACAAAGDATPRPVATLVPAAATSQPYPAGGGAPSPAATSGATSVPGEPEPRRLQITAGAAPVKIEGRLAAMAFDRYLVRGQAGQRLSIKIASTQANILYSVAGVDGNVLKSSGVAAPDWFAVLPKAQDYLVSIFAEQGDAVPYTLEVSLQ